MTDKYGIIDYIAPPYVQGWIRTVNDKIGDILVIDTAKNKHLDINIDFYTRKDLSFDTSIKGFKVKINSNFKKINFFNKEIKLFYIIENQKYKIEVWSEYINKSEKNNFISKNKKYFIYGLTVPIDKYHEKSTEELFKKTGYNNGNLAFHFALKNQIININECINWCSPIPKEFNNSYSTAIIPCANQLGEHTNLEDLSNNIKEQSCNFIAIGLGAQSDSFDTIPNISKGTLDWVHSIIEHSPNNAPNISLRGRYSQKVLEKYNLADKTVIIGCPSLFLCSNKNLGEKIEQNTRIPKRVAVVAGDPKWTKLNKIESSLVKIVTDTKGAYIGQSPLEMVKITRGDINNIKEDEFYEYRNYLAPEMSYSDFYDWLKYHGNTFFDIIAWMEYYKHFDFVIGARFHGIMLALQASIPALCIVHDSRTLEMCQTMKIPYVLAKEIEYGIKKEDLLRFFKFDSSEFDKNRINLCKQYIDFLNSNKIEYSPLLSNIAH